MRKLPFSVTIISVWIIASALLALMVNFLSRSDPDVIAVMAKYPIPIAVQLAWVYMGIAVSFVCGIGLLKRQNWARITYVVWTGLSLAVSFAASPVKAASIPGVFFLAVIAYFLFRPNVNRVFSGNGTAK